MTLDEVFRAGHVVAIARGTGRVVVQAPNPPVPLGWWLVKEGALPAVVYKQSVSPNDLAGTLGGADMSSGEWQVDDGHCWCEQCSSSRRFLETQTD